MSRRRDRALRPDHSRATRDALTDAMACCMSLGDVECLIDCCANTDDHIGAGGSLAIPDGRSERSSPAHGLVTPLTGSAGRGRR